MMGMRSALMLALLVLFAITDDNAVLKNVIVDGNNMNKNGILISQSSGDTS